MNDFWKEKEEKMKKTVVGIAIFCIFVSFAMTQETQPASQTQSSEIASSELIFPEQIMVQVSEVKKNTNRKYMVVVKGGKNYGLAPITELIDRSYQNPKISGLATEFRIRLRPRFTLGLEFNRKQGVLTEEKIYSFAPVLGIPDLKDTYTRKHTTSGFRINSYFVFVNRKHYELAVGLGGGADIYTYKKEFTVQYFSEGVINQRVLGSSKKGVLPGAEIIISNQLKFGRFSFLAEPIYSENGFSVALSGGISF